MFIDFFRGAPVRLVPEPHLIKGGLKAAVKEHTVNIWHWSQQGNAFWFIYAKKTNQQLLFLRRQH